MIITQEKGKEFSNYVLALRGQYGNNLPLLIYESNKEFFQLRKNQTNKFMNIPLNKIQVGKFYIILYNFNGNKLYAPIFVIDYRVTNNNKHVIYGINLDYLPFDYKLLFFNKLYELTKNIFNYNEDVETFLIENPIPVKFETIYNSLKENGDFNFSISAFDIIKIKECFGISTTLLYLMIHIHMRPINVKLMKSLMDSYENGSKEYQLLNETIQKLDDMVESYDNDVKEFYKKLRNIEDNYKLYQN
jgi:hypothetical protein